MKHQMEQTTTKKMRSIFSDANSYSDKYVVGAYDFATELFDEWVIKKMTLAEIFHKLQKLTLEQDIVIRYVYGIGRPKKSVVDTANHLNMSVVDVKKALALGKAKFSMLCRAC